MGLNMGLDRVIGGCQSQRAEYMDMGTEGIRSPEETKRNISRFQGWDEEIGSNFRGSTHLDIPHHIQDVYCSFEDRNTMTDCISASRGRSRQNVKFRQN